MRKKYVLMILLLAFTLFSRLYKLGEIPAGIHPDEESHAYNAYSILETGKDRYGESLPILFRSFGSYQPPVLTYLSIIPIALFGNTIFSARFINALFSVLLVGISYLLTLKLSRRNNYTLAFICALLVSISPWSFLFSRLTAEGYLGLTFFILSIFLFIASLEYVKIFPIACLVLGISTHTYYSERIISIIFLPLFIFLYKKFFKGRIKWLIFGLSIFVLTMIPHLLIASSGALTRRLSQVGYIGETSLIFEFIKKYLIYFSPRNLFFDTGADLGRITPEMGVYYPLLIIPFFFGIKYFKDYLNPKYYKLLLVLILITPVPVALTADNFYPLRALDLIWLIGLVLSIGVSRIYYFFPKKVRTSFFGIITTSFIFSFFISYFVLFKYEKAFEFPGLVNSLNKYKDKQIIIDSSRNYGMGLRLAYLIKYSPLKLQTQLKNQLTTPYYSSEVNRDEVYALDNITVRNFKWTDPCQKDTLIVGDLLTLSPEQAKEHNLKFEFDIKDLNGDVLLNAYLTNPREICF